MRIPAGHRLYTAPCHMAHVELRPKGSLEDAPHFTLPDRTFSFTKELIITFIFQLSIEDQCDLDDIYSFNRWEDSDLERI